MGNKITLNTLNSNSNNNSNINKNILNVPDDPIIPYIDGDGIGPEIWRTARHVFDSAVEKAYNGKRKVEWMEVLAGGKSFEKTKSWLPDETLDAFREYLVGIKGPLTTPIGKGIRSINVALRQKLDLYVCLRPVKYYGGIETPVRRPDKVDMVIFRENTEDIYAGIEFKAGTEDNTKFLKFLEENFPERFEKIRFGTLEKTNEFHKSGNIPLAEETEVGIGIKVISKTGSHRLMKAAMNYAIENKRKSITIVHKGNIMKFTSGAFRDWCYELAEDQYPEYVYTMMQWEKSFLAEGREAADKELNEAIDIGKIIIKDSIADNALQKVLTDPQDFDIIASANLDGDYLSDAIAAEVGGIGIAPGANINFVTGHAIFEATHGTAPSFAGLDKVNPSSLILSGMMMFKYLGWTEVSDFIEKGVRGAIKSKSVTFDFARQMVGAKEVKCSEFGQEIINHFD
ncbi:MAG TPA: NADP-dependent isocitrate dehydrogenase [Ignavibacteria bacterium]|nr:NADP-dependent isocitrate dehydrogenase [Ignavibacteria bacterium]HRA99595.1 NADP-dependent isocitrate dehydrogenase [Ignavibacteria bacterium]